MKHQFQLLNEFGKIFLLIILLGLTLSYAFFQGGFVSWFVFYSFLPFALYSLLVFIYPLSNIKVERTFESSNFKAGDQLTVTLSLTRRLPFPLFYLIVEELVSESVFSDSDFQKVKSVIFPGFKKKVHVTYDIKLPRGEHVFIGVRLKTGDFFNIFEKEGIVQKEDQLLVYPKIVPVDYCLVKSSYEKGTISSNVERESDATVTTGVREYQSGDRLSWIHWKSFARTNTLMTKEFEEQQSYDVLLCLDREPREAFESMVCFTASLLESVVKKGVRTGLISIGKEPLSSEIKGGEAHKRHLFYHLAKVKSDSSLPFDEVIQKNEQLQQLSVSSFMFITSNLSKKMISSIEELSKRNRTILIFLIKEKTALYTSEEKALKAWAVSKGIDVKVCYDGEFSTAFSGVKRA